MKDIPGIAVELQDRDDEIQLHQLGIRQNGGEVGTELIQGDLLQTFSMLSF